VWRARNASTVYNSEAPHCTSGSYPPDPFPEAGWWRSCNTATRRHAAPIGVDGAGHVQGGRGPCGLARSSRKLLLSPESMYPFCLYLRSLSIGESYSVLLGEKNLANYDQNSSRRSPKCRSLPRSRETDTASTVVSWDYQRGLMGVPKVQQTTGRNPPLLQIHMYHGTDMDCTPILSEQRFSVKIFTPAAGSTTLGNSISLGWHRAASGGRRSDLG